MKENIKFSYVTKDGEEHPINVSGVCTILDATMEIISSILNGDLHVDPADIIQIIDTEG